MEPRLNQPARDVLQLLAGLHEQVVSGRDLDWDALTCVARPDMQSRVSGAAVDGKEVKVRVEAGKDSVFGSVLG